MGRCVATLGDTISVLSVMGAVFNGSPSSDPLVFYVLDATPTSLRPKHMLVPR